MMWSDNPVLDAERYEYEKEKLRQERIYELPECDKCGSRIDDDSYYDFDTFVLCYECLQKHKKWLW